MQHRDGNGDNGGGDNGDNSGDGDGDDGDVSSAGSPRDTRACICPALYVV